MLRTKYIIAGRRQWSVENPGVPHPLDVTARLDELRELEDGWADGMQYPPSDWGNGYGKAPSHSGLDWLSGAFERHYPDDAPLPYTYPTPEGGIQIEWSLGPYEASVEIDLEERTGEWHCLNLETDVSDLIDLDLNNPGDWNWLGQEIRRLGSKIQ